MKIIGYNFQASANISGEFPEILNFRKMYNPILTGMSMDDTYLTVVDQYLSTMTQAPISHCLQFVVQNVNHKTTGRLMLL